MESRRTLFGAIGGGALMSLMASARQTRAQPTTTTTVPTDPFILLLRGVYVPITGGAPNLDLMGIDLNDGSYSRTRIYPVFGVPSADDQNDNSNIPSTPIGNFFVQFSGVNAVYQLPHGAIAMQFLPVPSGALPGYNAFVPHPDGQGGTYLEGTFELTITDATGIYAPFKGGHNHMVDRLHQLPDGRFDEFCFCNISQYPFP